MMQDKQHTGLIVVSNRLPVALTRSESGTLNITPGGGGLVTALVPVLRDRGGIWVGWPGIVEPVENLDALLAQVTHQAGYQLRPVMLTAEEQQKFYYGFSNEVIWPLFHDLQSLCDFDPSYWRTYCTVNRKYAEAIQSVSAHDDFIWVHDYQLMNVAQELRQLKVKAKTAFFLHIPFPSLDIFVKLPWRFQLLRALLEYDLIGFQTLRDQRNFIQCVSTLLKETHIYGEEQILTIKAADREIRVGSFPISIDFDDFVKRAATKEVADRVTQLQTFLPHTQLIFCADRLDYTKGIPHRLRAFRNALQRYPELQEHITLIQAVVPSREDIPGYNDLKIQIERLISEINGEFTRPAGWIPIHYMFRNLSRVDLLAYYRAAQICLVTPLKDGMNLVAKEYCACSIEEDCVLILSEFAGAAAQMQTDALLVNPNDIEGTADAIYQAYNMNLNERRERMRRLRRSIREQNIFWWVDSFLNAAIAKDLSAFPLPEDYIPNDLIADSTV